MDKINSSELLNQLQVLARKVQETNTQSTSDNEVAESSQFSELMKDSINKVNDQQMKAMGSQYRKILIKGTIGIVASSNLIQAALLNQ